MKRVAYMASNWVCANPIVAVGDRRPRHDTRHEINQRDILIQGQRAHDLEDHPYKPIRRITTAEELRKLMQPFSPCTSATFPPSHYRIPQTGFLSSLYFSSRYSFLRKAHIPPFSGQYCAPHEAIESPVFAEPLHGRDHERKFLVFLRSVTRRRLPCRRRRHRWHRFKGRISAIPRSRRGM